MSDPGTEPGKQSSKAHAVLEQMGGISGLIYSSLPVVVFVPVSSFFGLTARDRRGAGRGGADPGVAAGPPRVRPAGDLRVHRRRDQRADRLHRRRVEGLLPARHLDRRCSGRSVFALSILIRRPVVGYIWGWVNAHDRDWRRLRRAVVAFDIATIVWVLVFASRFVVQHHLYDADQTGWLGVARIAMGWPLTAVAALVTYLAIRAAQRALHAHDAAETGKTAPRTHGGVAHRMPTERTRHRRRADDTDRPLIAVAILASFVAFLDGSVVNLALPAIGREFGGGLALQQWVVDGYLLTLGALILVAGAISDPFGRLSVLRMGLVVFAVSSLLCALAPSGWVLVAARCLQGVGAAFLVPSSLAMINARFSGPAQARAIGTWTAWTGTAFVVGPLLGGVLVDALSWRWIFGVNIVPLAVTLYLTTKLSARRVRGRAGRAADRRRRRGAQRGRPDRRRVRAHRRAAARASRIRRSSPAWWSGSPV